MKINADLPFAFCAECKRRQIYYAPVLIGNGVIRLDTRCSRANSKFCEQTSCGQLKDTKEKKNERICEKDGSDKQTGCADVI